MKYLPASMKRIILLYLQSRGYLLQHAAAVYESYQRGRELEALVSDLSASCAERDETIAQLRTSVLNHEKNKHELLSELENLKSEYQGTQQELPNFKELEQIEKDPLPSILMVTMPKSGTVYILNKLSKGLSCDIKSVSLGYFPRDILNVDQMAHFVAGNQISCEHIDASNVNMMILNAYSQRVIVHVRDPRQALLSWVHHMDRMFAEQATTVLLRVCPSPPPTYYAWNLGKKIDWQLENYLPSLMNWVGEWLSVKDKFPSFAENILFTSYDDLVSDEGAFLKKIMLFYGISDESYKDEKIEKNMEVHYRKGDPSEWRPAFSPLQQNDAAKMITGKIKDYFGWL